ncbi:glycosyltransferase family 1 protein [Bacillus spongiae]|uniref:Glycosyltransferase family 1 protein n=1 Tax=Bacillus spongiae TaxID=2683610 RepID=A0ABU8HDA8_9BACI
MKVAIFTDTFEPQVNGVAKTLTRLTSYMQKEKIRYEVFAPEIENSPDYPYVHQFSSFPFIFYPECRTAIAKPKTIEKRLLAFQPDLIHVTTPLTMGLYGMRASKKLKIPAVASYHTNFDVYLDYYKLSIFSAVLWRYMKWFHTTFEKIFVPSPQTMDHLQQHGFNRLAIWGRGVDCERFSPEFSQKQQLKKRYNIKEKNLGIYVGRLAPEKDLDTFVKSIRLLSASVKDNLHWLIVGEGPSSQEIKEQLKTENVTFTGYLRGEDLAGAYASSDIFFFPSPTETFGNVVLEALASGVPAIVADSGGVKNIVQHEQTGFLCKPGGVEDFSGRIEQLMTDPLLRRKMSISAREYAFNQSWDRIFQKLFEEYQEVITSREPIYHHA